MTAAQFESIWVEILFRARIQREVYPQLRQGQSIFNAAFELFPKETSEITGDCGNGGKDCFYDDKNIPNFWEYLFKCNVDE